jgi:hypothetical protein
LICDRTNGELSASASYLLFVHKFLRWKACFLVGGREIKSMPGEYFILKDFLFRGRTTGRRSVNEGRSNGFRTYRPN